GPSPASVPVSSALVASGATVGTWSSSAGAAALDVGPVTDIPSVGAVRAVARIVGGGLVGTGVSARPGGAVVAGAPAGPAGPGGSSTRCMAGGSEVASAGAAGSAGSGGCSTRCIAGGSPVVRTDVAGPD